MVGSCYSSSLRPQELLADKAAFLMANFELRGETLTRFCPYACSASICSEPAPAQRQIFQKKNSPRGSPLKQLNFERGSGSPSRRNPFSPIVKAHDDVRDATDHMSPRSAFAVVSSSLEVDFLLNCPLNRAEEFWKRTSSNNAALDRSGTADCIVTQRGFISTLSSIKRSRASCSQGRASSTCGQIPRPADCC